MRPISEIIIHCSATRPDWYAGHSLALKVEEITRWHRARKFRAIGYHYLIDRDGALANGRPVEQAGAHVKGHNLGSIGVCLLGGHGGAETDVFSDHFTTAQAKTLDRLIADLKLQFGDLKLSGHNQYAAKACPCFSVPGYFENSPINGTHIEPEPKASPFAALFKAILSIFGGKK